MGDTKYKNRNIAKLRFGGSLIKFRVCRPLLFFFHARTSSTMRIISVNIPHIAVCKKSSSSTIPHNSAFWSPIGFSVSFDGLKKSPSWALYVVQKGTGALLALPDDSFCFMEGICLFCCMRASVCYVCACAVMVFLLLSLLCVISCALLCVLCVYCVVFGVWCVMCVALC